MKFALILLIALLSAALTGCDSGMPAAGTPAASPTAESAPDDAAARAVESYLTAKIAGDETTIRALLCSDMEADLPREVTAFSTVSDARIDDMVCTVNAGGATVTCTGAIVATYGLQDETFPLSTYRVVQEDGEWKWCGEGE